MSVNLGPMAEVRRGDGGGRPGVRLPCTAQRVEGLKRSQNYHKLLESLEIMIIDYKYA